MSAIGIDGARHRRAALLGRVERPGMLHAAFVRSPHPHARVMSVDASALPAGCVALTPEDVADLGLYGCQARDQRVLADVARHAGDVVAAVAAPTRASRPAPRRGWCRSTTRSCPRSSTPSRPSRPAPCCCIPHAADVGRRGGLDRRAPAARHERLPPLPARERRRRARASPRPTSIVEEAFRTPSAAHVPMEPHAALAEWEDGRLTVWAGTQTPFNTRADLAGLFGLDDERRPDRRAADGRLVRGQDVRAHRGARRRARAQGAAAGEGRARPHGGVRHAQPPPGDDARPDRRQARRHARGQGGRLLGRHRRLRRLRAGRRDEARLRRRRPVPDPARARRLARDLHEPAAQRRLPRLRRDAVGVGVRARRWTCSPSAWA